MLIYFIAEDCFYTRQIYNNFASLINCKTEFILFGSKEEKPKADFIIVYKKRIHAKQWQVIKRLYKTSDIILVTQSNLKGAYVTLHYPASIEQILSVIYQGKSDDCSYQEELLLNALQQKHSYKQIARCYNWSLPKTKYHIQQLYRKYAILPMI